MTRSLTVPVPPGRRIAAAVAAVVGGLLLLLVGVRLGDSLLSPSPVMSVASGGDVHQVQLLGGAVYLGHIVGDHGGAIRMSRPALLRQQASPTASGGQDGTQLVVQSLATDPFGIAGDIAIPLEQVTLIGVVAPTSSLGRAYAQALGVGPASSATPAP